METEDDVAVIMESTSNVNDVAEQLPQVSVLPASNLTANCCVPMCNEDGIFPCPTDPQLRRKWSKNIRRADLKYGLQWRFTDNYICKTHFTEDDIILEVCENTGEFVRKLKPFAVPTVFSTTIETTERMFREMDMRNHEEFRDKWTPESSNREARKLTRKIYSQGSRRRMNCFYDSEGLLRCNGKDVCDCLDAECPGCHFPCAKCQSPKCGHECRCDRRWVYENVEVEGTPGVIKNPFR